MLVKHNVKSIVLVQIGEKVPFSDSIRLMRTANFAIQFAESNPRSRVHWYGSEFDHYSKSSIDPRCVSYLKNKNVIFTPLRSIGYRSNLSARRVVDHIIVSVSLFLALIKSERPSVVICAYPDIFTAISSFMYCKLFRVPFVVDFRDSWPWLFNEYKVGLSYVNRLAVDCLVSTLAVPSAYVLRSADVVITMMPSYLEFLYSKTCNRKPAKADLFLPIGAPSLDKPLALPAFVSCTSSLLKPIRLVFIGSLNNTYAPFIVKDILALLECEGLSNLFHFTIAGDGTHYQPLLKMFNGEKNVSLVGYVDNNQITQLLNESDIGLLFQNSPIEALPNKLFTYLSAGLPILHNVPGAAGQYISSFPYSYYCQCASSLVFAMRKINLSIEKVRIGRPEAIDLFNRNLSSRVLTDRLYAHLESFINCDYC